MCRRHPFWGPALMRLISFLASGLSSGVLIRRACPTIKSGQWSRSKDELQIKSNKPNMGLLSCPDPPNGDTLSTHSSYVHAVLCLSEPAQKSLPFTCSVLAIMTPSNRHILGICTASCSYLIKTSACYPTRPALGMLYIQHCI